MRLEHWFFTIPLRLRSLFLRKNVDAELDEELAYHLDRQTQENIEKGMSPEEARRAAVRAMGGLQQQKEGCREARGVRFIDELLQDTRYAFRSYRNSPILTAVVILSLALGIGANTAIFSLINALILRPLPVEQPRQLRLLTWNSTDSPGDNVVEAIQGTSDVKNGRMWSYSFPLVALEQVSKRNTVFSSTVAFAANDARVNVGLPGHAEAARVQAVSGNYFQGLGVKPIVGRAFVESDDTATANPVVMISSNFWRGKLGADPAIAGKAITINGASFEIIGVTPPDFFGLEPGNSPDAYVPLKFYIARTPKGEERCLCAPLLSSSLDLTQRTVWWVGIVGRMKPGITDAQANAELRSIFDQAAEFGTTAVPRDANTPVLDLESVTRGLDNSRSSISTPLMLLMGMVGLVLMIACANVASLLLARANSRRREIAVRFSLGAPRLRVVRQLLTESVLLALVGGAVGILLARVLSTSIVALLASGRQEVSVNVGLDNSVLVFTTLVSVISGVLFGLAPALRATRINAFEAIKQVSGANGQGSRKFLSGKVLVGAQVALALLLLIGSGLFLGTLRRLKDVDIGFERRNLVTFAVQPGLNSYKGDRLTGYYRELQRRVASIPGVRSVGFSRMGPIASGAWIGMALPSGASSDAKRLQFWTHEVGPGYFSTLGIPVLSGRAIGPDDVQSRPKVIVVNREFVREFFNGQDPVGRPFDMGDAEHSNIATVVGVVSDVRYNNVRDEPPPTVYYSYLQRHEVAPVMTFEIRTDGDPATVLNAIQREALSLDRDVPLVNTASVVEAVSRNLYLERMFATLSTCFGAVALLLACVGLYGTIGYTVSQRTNEIGIRIALGARPGAILGMVLRETCYIVLGGVITGFPIAWICTRLLNAQLYGLSAHDPTTMTTAVMSIFAVTIIAGFLPARRASKVDPMVALRCE